MTPGVTVSTSFPIVLATGHIAAADELSIQLVEPVASPSVIMIVWPQRRRPYALTCTQHVQPRSCAWSLGPVLS